MRPWVEEHIRIDDAQRRRWLGADIDLTAKLPSDLIMKAAQVDPTIQPSAMGLPRDDGRGIVP